MFTTHFRGSRSLNYYFLGFTRYDQMNFARSWNKYLFAASHFVELFFVLFFIWVFPMVASFSMLKDYHLVANPASKMKKNRKLARCSKSFLFNCFKDEHYCVAFHLDKPESQKVCKPKMSTILLRSRQHLRPNKKYYLMREEWLDYDLGA